MADSPEPSFRALLRASFRVCAIALLLAVLAFELWRAAKALFPEVAWLQSGQ